jgi:hypothetical protein
MDDLTVIYLTVNQLPDRWVAFHMRHLKAAVQSRPVISISRIPMDFGTNLIQTETPSAWNVYAQLLRGSERARTPFVAVAEDDTLYSKEHFSEFRPPSDAVAYNMARWSLTTWRSPCYQMIHRRGNFAMIGPRALVVEALEGRMKVRHRRSNPGEIGRPNVERRLRITPRNAVEWYSSVPIVNVRHGDGLTTKERSGYRLKRIHACAYDIPKWGKALDILKEFSGEA